MTMFQKALIGYDGSKSSQFALKRAVEMAMDFGTELTALWVHEPLPTFSDLPSEVSAESENTNKHFKQICSEVREIARDQSLNICCITRAGRPAQTITQHADEGGYDLIVVGQSGQTEFWWRFLDNTSKRIADLAQCSVLIAKAV